MSITLFRISAAIAATLAISAPASAELNVVVTIKPVHALVAGVLGKAGTASLLVTGAASPHTFSLKPSDAVSLGKADVFVRVSEAVEPFTKKVLATLPKATTVVTLEDAPGVTLLPIRTGETFEGHDHGKDDGHGHAHGHGKAKAGKAAKPETDGHVWLDPANAKAFVNQLVEIFSKRQPADAASFKANGDDTIRQLDALDAELKVELAGLQSLRYVVFHDAFQYFERRYGLAPVGSITINPEVSPSGKRLTAIRKKIAGLSAVCIMREPQFDPKLATSVAAGLTSVRTGVLDPIGADLNPGPDAYGAVLRKLAAGLKACANPAS
jgi:zinc transport system substrate-binding protein